MKILYAFRLTEQAWEHKDYRLAQSLLKQSQLWYEQYLKKSKPEKSKNSGVDYHAELKISMLIDLIKTNVLLGKNATALILLDRLPSKKLQAKALVYVAITLAKKRKIQGESRADQSLLIDLEKRIKQIRKNV